MLNTTIKNVTYEKYKIAEIGLILFFIVFTILRLKGIFAVGVKNELEKDAETYLNLAEQSYERQEFSNALLNYWYAIKKERNLVKPYIRISQIFYHKNFWNNEAMIAINEALKKEPDNAQSHLIRGRFFRDEGQVEEAAKEFEKAIELKPDYAEAYYRLGLVYQALQLPLEFAIEEYQFAIEADKEMKSLMFESEPIGLQARFRLARIYKQRDIDRFNELIQLLTQAYSQEESSDETGRQRQSKQIREISTELINIFNEPIKLLEEIYKIDPSYGEAKQALIDLLYTKAYSLERIPNLRLYSQTLEIYEKIIKIDETQIDAWKYIGQINYFYENYERALEAYSKAFELNPNDVDTLANIEAIKLEMQKED